MATTAHHEVVSPCRLWTAPAPPARRLGGGARVSTAACPYLVGRCARRLRLAAALVHDPQVLVLDEPLNGTDPRPRLDFHDTMTRLADQGRTILISSHILEEVETLASTILLMVSGKLAAAGDFRAIREKLDEQAYRVRVITDSPRRMAAALAGSDDIDSVSVGRDGELTVLSRNVGTLQRSIPRLAQEHGIRLMRVEPLDDSLESIFSYVVDR